jgi:hypothetical protein
VYRVHPHAPFTGAGTLRSPPKLVCLAAALAGQCRFLLRSAQRVPSRELTPSPVHPCIHPLTTSLPCLLAARYLPHSRRQKRGTDKGLDRGRAGTRPWCFVVSFPPPPLPRPTSNGEQPMPGRELRPSLQPSLPPRPRLVHLARWTPRLPLSPSGSPSDGQFQRVPMGSYWPSIRSDLGSFPFTQSNSTSSADIGPLGVAACSHLARNS